MRFRCLKSAAGSHNENKRSRCDRYPLNQVINIEEILVILKVRVYYLQVKELAMKKLI